MSIFFTGFTGAFSVDGFAVHKCHDEEEYDDDVVSWFKEENEQEKKLHNDGYVSNVGRVVTIHIRDEVNTEKNIENIRYFFGIDEKHGVSEIKFERFAGWDL